MNLRNVKSIEQLEELIASGEINTFSKAIKVKCLECSGFDMREVNECPNERTCPLWQFRKGKRLKNNELI